LFLAKTLSRKAFNTAYCRYLLSLPTATAYCHFLRVAG